jgi:hypothetical protein
VLTCSISTGRFSDGDVVKLRMGERVELATAREKVLNMRVVMTEARYMMAAVGSCRHMGTRSFKLKG